MKELECVTSQSYDKVKAGYEIASAQLELAKSQVNQAKVSLLQAKQQLENTNITSPISGIITSKHMNEGEIISGMQLSTPILMVEDYSCVKLEVAVSEDLLSKVKKRPTGKGYA